MSELQCSLERGRRMKNRPAAGEILLRSCTKPCCWYLQLAARHPHATSRPHRKKVAHLHHLRLRPSKRTLQRQAAPPLEAAPTAASQVAGSSRETQPPTLRCENSHSAHPPASLHSAHPSIASPIVCESCTSLVDWSFGAARGSLASGNGRRAELVVASRGPERI